MRPDELHPDDPRLVLYFDYQPVPVAADARAGVLVLDVPPLLICSRIERSVGEPGSAAPPPSGTGRKPVPESGNELRSVARAASGNADAARLIQTRSMFAFSCSSLE
jgi:hypothetical protein